LSLVILAPVYAAIIPSGDIDPVYPGSDPWSVGGSLVVGWDAQGTLDVSGGSEIWSDHAILGYAYTGDGWVTLSGSGTLWDNAGELWIGGSGIGELRLDGGAWVRSDDVLIAIDSDGWGEGRLAVTGTNTRLSAADELVVGYTGVAVLLVEQGGAVSSTSGAIGAYPGSSGIAQVVDPDSLWANSGTLYVGGDVYGAGGTGILNVSDGAAVSTADLVIWPTGQLEGNGSVHARRVSHAGTLAPYGSLVIDGDLVFESSGRVLILLDNQGASDLVTATGAVTLQGGTVVAESTETLRIERDYRILEGASLGGQFAAVDRRGVDIALSDPGIPDLQLGYTSDAAYLRVVLLAFDDPAIPRTPNQWAVSRALQGMSDRGGNTLTAALGELNGLDAVRTAYDELSGQPRVLLPTVTLSMADAFQDHLRRRVSDRRAPEPLAHEPTPRLYGQGRSVSEHAQGTRAWGQIFGLSGRRLDNEETPEASWYGGGGVLGLDHWLTDTFLLGWAGGGTHAQVDTSTQYDVAEIESLQAGLYTRWVIDPVCLDGWVTYGDSRLQTERIVSLTGERVDGSSGGPFWGTALEGSWLWGEVAGCRFEPLVGGQTSRFHVDAYEETGGVAALSYGDQDWTSTRAWLGLRVASTFGPQGSGDIQGELHGRWVHEFADPPPGVSVAFVQDPLASFTVTDTPMGRDSFQLGGGLRADIGTQTQLLLHYHGLFNPDMTSHVLSGGLLYRW
jgi:T5SS/PEP-CTERM-associated repeat protein